MRWLTPDEEGALRIDFRDNEREIQKSFWMYATGVAVVLGLAVGQGSRTLLQMVTGNAGYNAFAVLALAAFNVMFACYLFYRSLSIHETMQLLVTLTPPDSGMLHWEAWRRSNQSATRPVRPLYFVVLLGLPLLVSIAILYGVAQLLRATDLLNAVREPLWTAWGTVLAFHALPVWFGYQNLGPTMERWKVIASVRGLEPSWFDVADPADDTGWLVDVVPQPDGTLVAYPGPEDVVTLSSAALQRYHHAGRFTVSRESLSAIRRLGARRALLHALERALGDAERVEIRFAHTAAPGASDA